MMKGLPFEVVEFLEQSNFIEGEVTGLDEAVKAWLHMMKQKQLTKASILKAHAILMKNKDIPFELQGAWRKPYAPKGWSGDVSVGGKKKANWYAVPNMMEGWIGAVNHVMTDKVVNNADMKKSAAITMHVAFEEIHPFIDGNGRMGRILMNWMMAKWNLPVLVIQEEQRFDYYKWFKGENPLTSDLYNKI